MELALLKKTRSRKILLPLGFELLPQAWQSMAYDPQFMELALEAAHRAYEAMEVPVGCVFVRNGEVLARGGNKPNASLNVRHFRI